MPFNDNDNNDDIDYNELKEKRAMERSEIRELERAYRPFKSINSDDFIALLHGDYQNPTIPGESDRITKPIPGMEKVAAMRRGGDYYRGQEQNSGSQGGVVRKYDRIERPLYEQQYENPGPLNHLANKYADVIETLERFPFADDETRRKKQLSVVSNSIRTALQELILEDVALNTRKAFGEHVDHVYKVAGGVKVIYNFNEAKCTVVAKGVFFGDETICVHSKNNKVVAGVYRIDGENSSNLTENFDITVA